MIPILHSTNAILEYIGTIGSKPVKVWCNDGNVYICKYDRRGDDSLLNEYLGTCFLRCCSIPTPEIAWIQIDPQHNTNKNAVDDAFLQGICFGSLSLPPNTVIDFTINVKNRNSTELSRINRIDLVQIALFDLWVSHQDRYEENTNLLIGVYENSEKERIIAIDNAAIFNFAFENQNSLVPLRYEQSMISSQHLKALYPKRNDIFHDAAQVVVNLQKGIHRCISNIDPILDDLHSSLMAEGDKMILKNWVLNSLCNLKHLIQIETQFYDYLLKAFPEKI